MIKYGSFTLLAGRLLAIATAIEFKPTGLAFDCDSVSMMRLSHLIETVAIDFEHGQASVGQLRRMIFSFVGFHLHISRPIAEECRRARRCRVCAWRARPRPQVPNFNAKQSRAAQDYLRISSAL